ncbi:hypothetical protein BP5796_02308 [Coleophoma crateriformis]|uniref:Uncharacterized protein n=1 Tax=Coleophoma crateriformis TaxID=565419 RepID=A0A3D8SXV4_9HELO|nr:hypothetical protein BP5796_02308 [Coleophoma crateriformis]
MTLVTIKTFSRLQEVLRLTCSPAAFTTLCVYLLALHQMGWELPAEAFDLFISEYHKFEEQASSEPRWFSYHSWFQERMAHHSVPRPPVTTLTLHTLETIRAENPYTEAYVQRCLGHIIKEHLRRDRGVADAAPAGKVRPEPRAVPTQGSTQSRTTPTPSPGEPAWTIPAPHGSSEARVDMLDQPWHSEKGLREVLGLRNREELLVWLKQDWVLDVYDEYCIVELDPRRQRELALLRHGHAVPSSFKTSWADYLIGAAAAALHHSLPRYCRANPPKHHWTRDDHDVRFIAQLVLAGRESGRWWEHRRGEDTRQLCTYAYRLLCWLRNVHRISSARGQSTQIQRAAANHWVEHLTHARSLRQTARSHT